MNSKEDMKIMSKSIELKQNEATQERRDKVIAFSNKIRAIDS